MRYKAIGTDRFPDGLALLLPVEDEGDLLVLLLDTHLFYDNGLQGGAQLSSDALLQQVFLATPCGPARILYVGGGHHACHG